MEHRELLHYHEYCVIPYRRVGKGVEFCLIAPRAQNRWGFPTIAADDAQQRPTALVDAAADVGLHGALEAEAQLGEFSAVRGNERRTVTGFLLHVDAVDDAWQDQANGRRIWCLAEEVRARVRRKPLRRFVDLALHAINPRTPTEAVVNGNGNGHAKRA